MESRTNKALDNHSSGYNCCQAVACAYCDLVDIDEKTIFALSEGFGSGMGNMENVCGTVSAMTFLAGAKHSCADPSLRNTKVQTYGVVRDLLARFKEKNTTVICRELKGIGTGTPLRSCKGCIEDACSIIEEALLNDQSANQ